MSSSSAFAEIWSEVVAHLQDARPLIPMYAHLIVSALFPIYAGAHASLSRPSSAARPEKKRKKSSDDEDEDEDKVQKMESMSNKDAIVLPITAGLVLASLYFLIKRYGADVINFIMGWYFSVVGVFSVAQLVNDGLKLALNFICPTWYALGGRLWRVSTSEARAERQDDEKQTARSPLPPVFSILPLPQGFSTAVWSLSRQAKQKYKLNAYVKTLLEIRANVTMLNALSVLAGLGTIIYVNTVSKPWFLTNLQGFAVSYSALQLMSPTTFATGSLILAALFCYDIWAVFFTPLMVTVAKNLDQPIKLVFPRPDEPSTTPGEPPTKAYSMLGLGDIVLPGIMIGLALRFDLYLHYLRKQRRTSKVVVGTNDEKITEEVIEKEPYVSATGRWGDRFWTYTLPKSSLPAQLRTSFSKPYFTASVVGYVIGMLTTLGVMSVFQHAQPALLYLVPGVLVSLWGAALVRGELKEMWEFTEALNVEQLEEAESTSGNKQQEPEVAAKGLFERLWSEIWSGSSDKTAETQGSKDGSINKPTPSKEGDTAGTAKRNEGTGDDNVIFAFSLARITSKAKDTAGHTLSTKSSSEMKVG